MQETVGRSSPSAIALFALGFLYRTVRDMTYPDYVLPILDVSRAIQKDFEALSGAVLQVPPKEAEAIDKLSRDLLGLRMAISSWASTQRLD